MGLKVLIFGAGGYIGIPLCDSLSARHQVVAVDRWFFGKKPKNSLCIPCDIRRITKHSWGDIEYISREKFLEKDGSGTLVFDAVIDLAGLSNDASAEIDPYLTRQINEEGGKRLATMAKQAGVKRYIYSSSASVYGHGLKDRLKETDPVNPLTAYARSKVAVEDHLLSLADDGFEPVILRNATVFGLAPRMRFDLAVNIMTLRAFRDNVIYVMGGGDQQRPFLHVSDIVRAFVMALESDKVAGQTYNVGDDRLNCTIQQVAGIVHHEFPQSQVHVIPEDPDQRSYNLDFSKIKNELGFVAGPTIAGGVNEIKAALEAGLKDTPECYTVQFYRSLLDWDKRLNEIRLDGRIL